ncbi:SHOCT domain-containing protein [Niabella digestorum]|jgi:hypothetical protein|uniref:SHOCT domain-containing protein n=1 Tax=Niabella digestorum TaxID=3117701 RepID=A0ABU7RG03_9BACT
MKNILLLCLLIIPSLLLGQKFYVIEPDHKINDRISKRISQLGFVVVRDIDEADIIAQMIYEKRKGYMSFKTGWKNEEYKYNKVGYIAFLNKDRDTLSATEEQGGKAKYYNTYVALSELTNKILKYDFDKNLFAAIKKVTPSSSANPQTTSSQNYSKADELSKLKKLLDEGVLTQEEFEAEKKKLLNK